MYIFYVKLLQQKNAKNTYTHWIYTPIYTHNHNLKKIDTFRNSYSIHTFRKIIHEFN